MRSGSPDSVSGGSTLEKVVREIEFAFDAGDMTRVMGLIQQDPLCAWFGLHPHRFAEILQRVTAEGAPASPLILAFQGIVFRDPSTLRVELREGGDEDLANVLAIGKVFSLRLAGNIKEAFEETSSSELRFQTIRPIYSWDRGWNLFSAVQRGITATLAGEFSEALVSFTHARMHGQIPGLEFMSRDACVKQAAVEALYGNVTKARVLLAEAAAIKRTTSWAETEIDAVRAMVEALLNLGSPAEALCQLDAIAISELGESWPLYTTAVHRALHALDNKSESARRNAMYDELPLPSVDGNGFTGSARTIASSLSALSRGEIAVANSRVERADQSMLLTSIVRAQIDLTSGRANEALQRALGARERSQGLRLLETWRLGIVASSYLALGDEQACDAVIRQTLAVHQQLRLAEVRLFSRDVRVVAESRYEEWPKDINVTVPAGEPFGLLHQALTDREIAVLRLLARGHSREQIARDLFISVNTLKGHLQSLYRKLGVTSRAEAIAEGELRGLL